jgi:peptidoglycan/LPS O-acetylase OafA/YrhL
MGIGVARLVATRAMPRPRLIAGLGVMVFALAAILDVADVIGVNQLITVLLYGAASALIIAGIAAAEIAGLIRCGRLAEVFGAASYVLYLIHPMVVGLVARGFAASELLWHLPDWFVVMTQVAVALAAAILVHRLIEQPLMRAIRGLERWHGRDKAARPFSH